MFPLPWNVNIMSYHWHDIDILWTLSYALLTFFWILLSVSFVDFSSCPLFLNSRVIVDQFWSTSYSISEWTYLVPQIMPYLWQCLRCTYLGLKVLPGGSMVKILPAMQKMQVWSLGWEDPLEKGMATHFQFSCPENPKNRGAWQATVHGVAKSWTWPSDFHVHFFPMSFL